MGLSNLPLTPATFTPTTDNPVNPVTVQSNVSVGQIVVVASIQGSGCTDSQGNSYTLLKSDGILRVYYSFLTTALTSGSDTITVTGSYGLSAAEGTADTTTPFAGAESTSGTETGPGIGFTIFTHDTAVITLPGLFFQGTVTLIQVEHTTGGVARVLDATYPHDQGSQSPAPSSSGAGGFTWVRAVPGPPFYNADSFHWVTAANATGTIQARTQGIIFPGQTTEWAVVALVISNTDTSEPDNDDPLTGTNGPWNLETGFGQYQYVHPVTGNDITYYQTFYSIPTDVNGPFTVAGGGFDAQFRMCEATYPANRVTGIWRRIKAVVTANTDDDGATWSTPVSLWADAKHPTVAHDARSGVTIFAAYVTDHLEACLQGPGESTPGAAFTLTDGTDPLVVDDATFHIQPAADTPGRWLLILVDTGAVTHYISTDEGPTWTAA